MSISMMTAKQLMQVMLQKKPLYVLDVRNEEDYADWKIEGEAIRSLNIPYFDLLDDVTPLEGRVPKDQDVLVVCAKEGSSQMVAEEMLAAGWTRLSVLEGGMKSWSEYLHPVKIGNLPADGAIYQFVRPGKGCLSYLIEVGGEALLVDVNRMTDVYREFAAERGVTIRYVLDTHLHADHISGGRALAKQTGAKYYLPPNDAADATYAYEPLTGETSIVLGNNAVKVQPVYTPGHTIGSTSLIVDGKYLLTGDILFVESIGRPDLAGKADEWVNDLRKTLYDTYRQLPDELFVLPAHYGNDSEQGERGEVMARLKRLWLYNKGLNIEDIGQFRRLLTENLPPEPNAYQEIRQTNMGLMKPDKEKEREMEIGPNRCAVHE